jgi:adenylate kinase family enzyme
MTVGRRINVIGCSGSGKSTFARALAERLDLNFVELDAFQHQANWRTAEREEFLGYVAEAVKAEAWVIDGNYSMIRPTVWPLLDTIIWLDYPMSTCLWRVWKRTFFRWARREILWNGNREHLWWHFFSRNSLLLWVLTSHREKRRQFGDLFASPDLQAKTLIRFDSPRQTQKWFRQLICEPSQPGLADIAKIEA